MPGESTSITVPATSPQAERHATAPLATMNSASRASIPTDSSCSAWKGGTDRSMTTSVTPPASIMAVEPVENSWLVIHVPPPR
jgi:hypothetical protein